MARKVRSDIKIGNLEKKLGVAPGTITNPDGSDARSDKKLGTLRKEFSNAIAKKAPATKTKVKSAVTAKKSKISAESITNADQRSASKRKVKSNPKTSPALVKKVSAAIRKSKIK